MSRLQRLPWSVLLIGIVSLMSGCSLLGQSDVSAVTYVLRATSPGKERPVAEVGKASALKVITGVAAPGYDTDRVLLSRADRSLDFFAASRWAASIPRVVDALALEVWRERGGAGAVHAAPRRAAFRDRGRDRGGHARGAGEAAGHGSARQRSGIGRRVRSRGSGTGDGRSDVRDRRRIRGGGEPCARRVARASSGENPLAY